MCGGGFSLYFFGLCVHVLPEKNTRLAQHEFILCRGAPLGHTPTPPAMETLTVKSYDGGKGGE